MNDCERPTEACTNTPSYHSLVLILKSMLLSALLFIPAQPAIVVGNTIPTGHDIPEPPSPSLPQPMTPRPLRLQVELAPALPRNMSSNLLMVWRDPASGKMSHRSFNFSPDEFEIFARVTSLLPKDELNDLMERTKDLSTAEFIAVLRQKQSDPL